MVKVITNGFVVGFTTKKKNMVSPTWFGIKGFFTLPLPLCHGLWLNRRA
jgi:hypothetical protein